MTWCLIATRIFWHASVFLHKSPALVPFSISLSRCAASPSQFGRSSSESRRTGGEDKPAVDAAEAMRTRWKPPQHRGRPGELHGRGGLQRLHNRAGGGRSAADVQVLQGK